MIGHIIALAIPIAGVLIVVILAATPSPTRTGTSAKPEDGDPRQERR